MKRAELFADRRFRIGEISPLLFGAFVEQMGRGVYTGLYEPGHPEADGDGFRTDVLAMVRELGVPIVRYPGGNFVSNYHWRDGVGDRRARPVRPELAWRQIEDNAFGTDEFLKWCRKAGAQAMFAVNLGTGTLREAAEWVEYTNFPAGTSVSDLRAANGHPEPYGVKYWCLGNEMDGAWQIGRLEAADYVKKAAEAAKVMRCVDAELKLIACGSSSPELPTFPDWDRVVLEGLYQEADYLSMHRYYTYRGNERDFLGAADDMGRFIEAVAATADFVRAKLRSPKRMMLSFDEWNVWNFTPEPERLFGRAPRLLEDHYNVLDMLVFGGMINALVNHADRVKLGCLAQLVNVLAPILTEPGGGSVRQTIFYPFRAASRYARGTALRVAGEIPVFDCCYGEARLLNAAVCEDAERGELSAFLVNYGEEVCECFLRFGGYGDVTAKEWTVLRHDDLKRENSIGRPGEVLPSNEELPKEERFPLPAYSWNHIRFSYVQKK